MSVIRSCQAFAPPSIGNFAVGFDVLGVALEPLSGEFWGDIVEIRPATTDTFSVSGAYASKLNCDLADNLVLQARTLFDSSLSEIDLMPQTMSLTLQKNLPVCSGLGSSASSIVAALVALNYAYHNPLSDSKLLELAGKAEGGVSGGIHLDNVAPSLFGGAQVCVNTIDASPVSLPLLLPESWFITVVHPQLEVATAMAREVLPEQIALSAGVSYWANLAGFLAALHGNNIDLAKKLLADSLIEPFRVPLVKGFDEVHAAALEAGAFACNLSGSGPSVFAVSDSAEEADNIRSAMLNRWQKLGILCEGWVCRANARSAQILEAL